MDCIFCKIANKEAKAETVYENGEVIAFKDINPSAPVHILVISKKHIASVIDLTLEDKEVIGEIIIAAQKIAKDMNLSGYKLIFNVGREGGQMVDHLHLHLLAGRPAKLP